ncbi:MAG TPA: hypothetical protein ENH15_01345 [Actinobacteria bacterium]|nr:hypothetical protein [Actinomycetota bacterium]
MDIDTLLAQWRVSETKLYPMVVVSPHQYEANLSLVRAMTDDLADVTTAQDLIEAYEHRLDRLATAVRRLGAAAPPSAVAPLVIDAAFQGRYRELPSEIQQATAVRQIAEAGKGPAWVLIGEAGDDGPDAATGFRRIEMRVPDGLGMHTYVDIDATTFLPLYGIEVLQLDPTTGEHAEGQARPERTEFADRQVWLTAIAEFKGRPHQA